MSDIRQALQQDLEAILRIENAAGFNRWSEKQLQHSLDNDTFFVLECDTEVKAYTVFHWLYEDVELLNIVVEPDSQRHGYGERILNFAMSYFANKNTHSCFLEVGVENHSALRLYHKLGFEKVGLRKNYYKFDGLVQDALVYKKTFLPDH